MRPGVVGDRVALHHFAAGDLRQALGVAADLEECRANALIGKRAQDFRRRLGGGTVVEGEDDFMVGERDRSRVGFEADFESALSADLGDARRSKLVGPASLGARRAGAENDRSQRSDNPH